MGVYRLMGARASPRRLHPSAGSHDTGWHECARAFTLSWCRFYHQSGGARADVHPCSSDLSTIPPCRRPRSFAFVPRLLRRQTELMPVDVCSFACCSRRAFVKFAEWSSSRSPIVNDKYTHVVAQWCVCVVLYVAVCTCALWYVRAVLGTSCTRGATACEQ
jgi:hypothetical protein